MAPCVVAFSQLFWLPVWDEKPRQHRVVPGQTPFRIFFVVSLFFSFHFSVNFSNRTAKHKRRFLKCNQHPELAATYQCLWRLYINSSCWELDADLSNFIFISLYFQKYPAPLPSFLCDLWPIVSIPQRLTCLLCPTPNVAPGHRTVAPNNNAQETRGFVCTLQRAHKHEHTTQHPN